jgi:hypothetical protein
MPTPPAPKHDPTSPFVRQVIELYAETLPQARFPDLDLEVLQAERDKLHVAQLALERAEAELAEAQATLDAAAAALEVKAERALAYARVYASGDAALSARLADFSRKKPEREGEPATPRKRKRKGERSDDLFGGGPPAADGGEPQAELQ